MIMGCFMFSLKSLGFSFLNSLHSVAIMQQSASLRQLMADVAYLIWLLKIFFAVGIATGS